MLIEHVQKRLFNDGLFLTLGIIMTLHGVAGMIALIG